MNRFFLFLLFPITGWTQSNSTVKLDKYMNLQANIRQFNGAVMVVKKGTILYSKAFGESDKEWNSLNTVKTKFRIGSNTKQFTAACILKLQEQKKLALDDKLTKYIPDYPKGDSVTIHMLLTHTSGITDYTNLDEFWNSTASLQLKPASFISIFKNKPYDFTPGTQCSYSNSGYYLLGIIIEKVSGERYADYLEKSILIPAGLTDTRIDRLDSVLRYRAKGYFKDKDTYYNAPYISMEGSWSAGALYSTVEDLYKWMKVLYHGNIITGESLKKMITPHATDANEETFGYGLMIDSLKKHSRIWHDGGIPGFASYMAYYPNDDIYIIALSNNSSNTINIGVGIAYLLFDLPFEMPYIHKEIKLNDNSLIRFVGKYDAPTPFEIIIKDGKLYRHRSRGKDILLKPESATKLFYDDDSDRQLEFEFNKDNTVSKAFIIISGIKTEIKKLN